MTRCHSLLSSLALVFLLAAGTSAFGASIQISEALYDAVGSDDGRVFVELFGPAALALDDYTLEGINGANGAVGPVIALSGVIPDDGFFVVADQAGGVTEIENADLLGNFDFQNGPDSIVLRGPGGELVDALGYGSFGPDDVFAGEGTAAPDGIAGESLARRFANVDTDDNAADFEVLSIPTPGTGPLELPEPGPALLLGAWLASLAWLRGTRANPPEAAPARPRRAVRGGRLHLATLRSERTP